MAYPLSRVTSWCDGSSLSSSDVACRSDSAPYEERRLLAGSAAWSSLSPQFHNPSLRESTHRRPTSTLQAKTYIARLRQENATRLITSAIRAPFYSKCRDIPCETKLIGITLMSR